MSIRLSASTETVPVASIARAPPGDDVDTILAGYPWLEREDVLACVEYARRPVAHERVLPRIGSSG